MSDLMLKQFEAWAVIDNQYSIARTYTDLRYDEDDTEAAWDAWQASRECLVIDLPDTKEIMPLSPSMYVHEMRKIVDENKYTRAIDLARCAIHEAGVKTK